MADIKYYDVILKPVITEKSMAGMGEKKYTFLVHPEANKSMIKEAVEKMFDGAKVAKVNTMNMDGKTKRRGMTYGKTAKTKKAIVQLTADSKDIEIFSGLSVTHAGHTRFRDAQCAGRTLFEQRAIPLLIRFDFVQQILHRHLQRLRHAVQTIEIREIAAEEFEV